MIARSQIVALAVGVLILIFLSPQAAILWSLNSANANIARAMSLPSDAPARGSALAAADDQLNQARDLSRTNDSTVALARARVLMARNESSGAVDALSSAGSALQSDFIAQFLWANAAWQVQQSSQAYEHWRAADARIFFVQQMYRASFKHLWQESEQAARIAVGIAPEIADAHYVLADAISHRDANDSEALRELDRAAALTHDDEFLSTILSRKAEIFAEQGKLQGALNVFDQARQVAPIDARPRTGYALTRLKLEPSWNAPAVDLLTQVVGDSPWYTSAYVALADIQSSRGDMPDAEAWLKRGLAKNPDDAVLLFALGKLYACQNRVDEARKTLIAALQHETHWDDLQAISHVLNGLAAQ